MALHEPPAPTGNAAPDVSIIVPVYRQWRALPHLLASLADQDMPHDRIEVILVNNDPNRASPAGPAPASPGPRLRWVACAETGSYAARNAGAAQAQGALFLFTDADCRPAPGWASALCAAIRARPDGLVAGRIDIPASDGAGAWEIFDSVRGIPQDVFVRHGYGATANLAVPATIFRALGGFRPGLLSGGDAEFCRRAGRAGHSVTYAPQALVIHPARRSLAALIVKARRVKGGQVASGPALRRIFWVLRSLVPPVREMLHYAKAPHPARQRLVACGVRMLLWGAELAEVARLLAGGTPERR